MFYGQGPGQSDKQVGPQSGPLLSRKIPARDIRVPPCCINRPDPKPSPYWTHIQAGSCHLFTRLFFLPLVFFLTNQETFLQRNHSSDPVVCAWRKLMTWHKQKQQQTTATVWRMMRTEAWIVLRKYKQIKYSPWKNYNRQKR